MVCHQTAMLCSLQVIHPSMRQPSQNVLTPPRTYEARLRPAVNGKLAIVAAAPDCQSATHDCFPWVRGGHFASGSGSGAPGSAGELPGPAHTITQCPASASQPALVSCATHARESHFPSLLGPCPVLLPLVRPISPYGPWRCRWSYPRPPNPGGHTHAQRPCRGRMMIPAAGRMSILALAHAHAPRRILRWVVLVVVVRISVLRNRHTEHVQGRPPNGRILLLPQIPAHWLARATLLGSLPSCCHFPACPSLL